MATVLAAECTNRWGAGSEAVRGSQRNRAYIEGIHCPAAVVCCSAVIAPLLPAVKTSANFPVALIIGHLKSVVIHYKT